MDLGQETHASKHTALQIGDLSPLSHSYTTDMEICNVLSVLRLHWLQLFVQYDILVSSYQEHRLLFIYSLIPRPCRRDLGMRLPCINHR